MIDAVLKDRISFVTVRFISYVSFQYPEDRTIIEKIKDESLLFSGYL